MSSDLRQENMQKLKEMDVASGPEFRACLLEVVAKDLEHDQVAEFIDVISPFPIEGEDFDLARPRLGTAGLRDVDGATLLLRMVIVGKLVPLVQGDKPASATLLSLCRALVEMIDRKPAHISAVLQGALDELSQITTFFAALSEPLKYLKGFDTDSILDLRGAKHGGKALLRHAVNQSPHWRELQSAFSKVDIAHKSFGPDIEACVSSLQEHNPESVRAAIEQVPMWQDAVGEPIVRGVLAGIRAALQSYHCEWVEKLREHSGPLDKQNREALEAFIGLLEFGYNMLADSTYEQWRKEMEEGLQACVAEIVQGRINAVFEAYEQCEDTAARQTERRRQRQRDRQIYIDR